MATITVTTLDDETFGGGDLAAESADGGGLSLREALALAQDGDTIAFDGALSGGTLTLTNGQLVITQDDLLLDGDIDNNGTADITIDADDASRVLHVTGGDEADPNNVTLYGLNITGGQLATGDGAGILIESDADVTVQNSHIFANTIGSEGSGGGVFVRSLSTLNLINSSVYGNSAAFYGGAIGTIATTAKIYITDSYIALNEANNGGGVYSRGTTVINEGSLIRLNDAAFGGGVMSGGNLSVYGGSTISDNTASVMGGGVFVEGTASFDGAYVTGNSAGLGGGIFNQSGTLTINNSSVNGNYASSYGGGAYSNDNSTTVITNSTLDGNHAGEGAGGALFFDSVNTGVVANSTISNNGLYASGVGGGAAISGTSSVDFINTTFYGNYLASGGGAALYVQNSSTANVYSSTFTGNTTNNSGFGGAVGATGSATVALSNSILVGNSAAEGWISVYAGEGAVINSLGGNIFDQSGVGGAQDITETDVGNVFLSTSNAGGFEHGVLADNGGPVETVLINPLGVAVDAGDEGDVPADMFDLDGDSNVLETLPVDARGGARISGASVDAGAVELHTLVVNTTAVGSGADGFGGGDLATEAADGGGLSLAEAIALAQNGDTIAFDASISGGTIGVGSEYGTLTISQEGLIIDGDIDNDGVADITIHNIGATPALALTGGTVGDHQEVKIDGIYFNSAGYGTGAGVSTGAYTNLALYNSTFLGMRDSAVSLGDYSNAIVDNTRFIINDGEYGGAIRASFGVDLSVTNSYFYANSADQGGAISALEGSSIYVADSQFILNGTSGRGGALYIASSGTTLGVYNSQFVGNYSDVDGGAIFIENGVSATIGGSTFQDNSSGLGNRGGALYSGGTETHVSDSSFVGNNAAYGGGIYAYGGNPLTVLNSQFTNNYGSGTGGGIASRTQNTYIINSTFAGNSTNTGGLSAGGGVYISSVFSVIANSTFYGNSSYAGGGVENAQGDLLLADSTFTGNSAFIGGGVSNGFLATKGYISGSNNLFAGNYGASEGTHDVVNIGGSKFYSYGGNLFGQTGLAGVGDIQSTDLSSIFNKVIVNPYTGLSSGQLRDNGGPISTVMLLYSGLAWGAGNASELPADVPDLDGDLNTAEDLPIDARGADRISNGSLDIGAVELELISGTSGADTITGSEFAERIIGDAGDDLLRGEGSHDTLYGGDGLDTLYGGDGDDTIDGGKGDDFIYGGLDNDNISGYVGNDTLAGQAGDDTIQGGGGDDKAFGNGGDDRVNGGSGNDTLTGSAGNDTMYGGAGDDELFGNADNDKLIGEDDNDKLVGLDGDDQLYAGKGDDTLKGGLGNDTMSGGGGADLFVFETNAGDDFVSGFSSAQGDQLQLKGITGFDDFSDVQAAASQIGDDVVIDLGGGDSITLAGVNLGDLHASDFLFG